MHGVGGLQACHLPQVAELRGTREGEVALLVRELVEARQLVSAALSDASERRGDLALRANHESLLQRRPVVDVADAEVLLSSIIREWGSSQCDAVMRPL